MEKNKNRWRWSYLDRDRGWIVTENEKCKEISVGIDK